MNRIERLAATLLLLQDRPHTSEEIARRFEVSRRTVLRDVQALSEMGVPVIAQEGPGGGYSLPEEYRTEPLPLTRNEAFLMQLALSALQGMGELPFREELAPLQAKLRAVAPKPALSGAEEILAAVSLRSPDRDQQAPFLEALIEAARGARWVKVVYESNRRTSTQHLLPLEIYAENGLWYCRAYADEHSAERTYRIDRVRALEPPEEGFQPGPVTPGLPYGHSSHPQISARLTPRGAALVESDPNLGPQLRRLEDRSAALVFRCPPGELDWYTRYFAGLGNEVEILAPEELRLRLRQLGKDLVDRYEKR